MRVEPASVAFESEALKDVEPMAWDFVMNFARDNQLQLTEACLVPPVVKKTG